MADASFQEKSAWGSLLFVLLFGTWYFVRAFQLAAGGPPVPAGDAAVLMFTTLGGLIVVEVVYHILIALPSGAKGPPPDDERDRLIEVRSAYLAHFVLAFGVFGAMSHCALTSLATELSVQTAAQQDEVVRLRWLTPFVTANILLLTFLASEVVSFVAKLVYYRRGF